MFIYPKYKSILEFSKSQRRINPVQLGNLIIFLLLLQVMVEDKEDLETSEFYTEQIKTIIIYQLEGSDIYDQSLSKYKAHFKPGKELKSRVNNSANRVQ